MEAAADVVAHAAERHRAQRLEAPSRAAAGRRCARARRSRNSSSDGRGNLGASPKPPRRWSNASCELLHARGERVGAGRRAGRRRGGAGVDRLAQARQHLLGRRVDAPALARPGLGDAREELQEAGPAPARRGRKVGAAEEGLERRREPHAHRPAARAGGRLHEGHVDPVHVGPLLAVHLDRHEVARSAARATSSFSNDSCAITWHQWQVGVADRQEDRLVGVAGRGEGLLAPGVPVDGVVGVLQEVRAALRARVGWA